jgi:hypothetical protein
MDATPQPELEELAQLLLAPADPVLPTDRHLLLKERFISNLTEQAHDSRSRRRIVIRAAAPIALTAAVAVVVAAGAGFLTSSPTTTSHATISAARSAGPSSAGPSSAGPRRAGPSSAVPRVGTLPEHIRTVAYALDLQAGDFIKITVHNPGTGTPDAAQLQKDLARMGVNATVSRGITHCTPQLWNLAERDQNGDYVATVPRQVIFKYPETIIFSPDLSSDPDPATLTVSVGTLPGAEPTCAPLPSNQG